VKKWVTWYKRYRAILESDVIHASSRRADGRDLDWVLHANPNSDPRGMLVVFNPTDEARTRDIPLDLYFTGIEDHAEVRQADGTTCSLPLDRFSRGQLAVEVPAGGAVWFAIR